MKIIIMTIDGKRIPLEVEPTDTVDTVKRMIEKIEGTSPGNQNLKFAGKELRGGTLADYNVQKESTLHMVQRFPGGGE